MKIPVQLREEILSEYFLHLLRKKEETIFEFDFTFFNIQWESFNNVLLYIYFDSTSIVCLITSKINTYILLIKLGFLLLYRLHRNLVSMNQKVRELSSEIKNSKSISMGDESDYLQLLQSSLNWTVEQRKGWLYTSQTRDKCNARLVWILLFFL